HDLRDLPVRARRRDPDRDRERLARRALRLGGLGRTSLSRRFAEFSLKSGTRVRRKAHGARELGRAAGIGGRNRSRGDLMRFTLHRVALVALPLALAAGVALAAQPTAPRSTTSAVINACVKKKTGLVRISASCKKGESRLAWNSQGPAGARGANGS